MSGLSHSAVSQAEEMPNSGNVTKRTDMIDRQQILLICVKNYSMYGLFLKLTALNFSCDLGLCHTSALSLQYQFRMRI